MLAKFLILLTLLSASNVVSSRSVKHMKRINTNDFCKLNENKCSQRYAPHVHQCERGVCTINETECKKYLRIKNTVKNNRMNELIRLVALVQPMGNYLEIKLEENFIRFQSNMKKCSPTRFKWQPTDVCVRGRHCFSNKSNTVELKKVNCSCPKSQPYVCGSHRSYCSLNKQVCDSFSYTAKNTNSTDRFQLLDIRTCSEQVLMNNHLINSF